MKLTVSTASLTFELINFSTYFVCYKSPITSHKEGDDAIKEEDTGNGCCNYRRLGQVVRYIVTNHTIRVSLYHIEYVAKIMNIKTVIVASK